MTWTGQSFTVGQVLTAAQMNNLQADITALANADSGAPDIGPAIAAANAGAGIQQGDLSTTTAAQFTDLSPGSTGTVSPTGATYALNCYYSGEGTGTDIRINPDDVAASTADVGFYNNAGGATLEARVYHRYIQASPPYDMGDGDVPLFIYALIENGTGKITGMSVAPDPHWAYHGPTNIAGRVIGHHLIEDKGDDRRVYARVPLWMAEDIDIQAEILKGGKSRAHALNMLRNSEEVEIEVDHAWKNRDMNIVTHPFKGYPDLDNSTIVLIDPMSRLVEELGDYHNAISKLATVEPDAQIDRLFKRGEIKIDNVDLRRAAPHGIMTVNANWR